MSQAPEPPLAHLAAARASSVLRRNVREFGVMNALDGSEDTCWNSDNVRACAGAMRQGKEQFIELDFRAPVSATELRLQFQGGFSAADVVLEAAADAAAPWAELGRVHPDDSNDLQRFAVAIPSSARVRVRFLGATDFYGRITLYRLELA